MKQFEKPFSNGYHFIFHSVVKNEEPSPKKARKIRQFVSRYEKVVEGAMSDITLRFVYDTFVEEARNKYQGKLRQHVIDAIVRITRYQENKFNNEQTNYPLRHKQ